MSNWLPCTSALQLVLFYLFFVRLGLFYLFVVRLAGLAGRRQNNINPQIVHTECILYCTASSSFVYGSGSGVLSLLSLCTLHVQSVFSCCFQSTLFSSLWQHDSTLLSVISVFVHFFFCFLRILLYLNKL